MRFIAVVMLVNALFSFSAFAQANSEVKCNDALWKHVYHNKRLQVIDPCIRVTGVIEGLRYEKDGDIHILLRPVQTQDSLLNEMNKQKKEGCLVIEIICIGKIKDKTARQACRGYENEVTIPEKGQRVTVTGSLVKDLHHGWMEIHPVTDFKVSGKDVKEK